MFRLIIFVLLIFSMRDIQANCNIPFHLENEKVCRYYLDDYFSFKMESGERKKLNFLINEACTCIRKDEPSKPFFCVDAGVKRTKEKPLNVLERCVRKYKGNWFQY